MALGAGLLIAVALNSPAKAMQLDAQLSQYTGAAGALLLLSVILGYLLPRVFSLGRFVAWLFTLAFVIEAASIGVGDPLHAWLISLVL